MAPVAGRMNGAGNHLFSCPGFSAKENRRAPWSNPTNQPRDIPHSTAAAHQKFSPGLILKSRPERRKLSAFLVFGCLLDE